MLFLWELERKKTLGFVGFFLFLLQKEERERWRVHYHRGCNCFIEVDIKAKRLLFGVLNLIKLLLGFGFIYGSGIPSGFVVHFVRVGLTVLTMGTSIG